MSIQLNWAARKIGISFYALIVFLCLATSPSTYSQSISSIRFEGIQKTKIIFLENLMKSKEGNAYNPSVVEKDVQNLKNTQLFSEVSAEIIEYNDSVQIIFTCNEVITLLPIINFGGVKDNFFFQLGVADYHFLGKGMTLQGYYLNYDRHTFFTHFRKPFFVKSKWGVNALFNKYSTVEPLYFGDTVSYYEYDNWTGEVLAIYNIDNNINHNIEMGGGIFNELYKKDFSKSDSLSPGPIREERLKYLLKTTYRKKDINYDYHYLSGFFNQFNLETVFTEGIPIPFFKFQNEIKIYQKIGGKGNLAGRFTIGFSSNNVGPFAPFVLDSYMNIRGVGNRVSRGTGQIVLNLEHRQTLWNPNWGALQGVAFVDAGTWRFPGKNLKSMFDNDAVETFVGLGGRVIVYQVYSLVLRADFGFDVTDFSKNGIVLGIGQYF